MRRSVFGGVGRGVVGDGRDIGGAERGVVGYTAHPHGPGRRSIRLRGYDYSQHGAYYVTICVQDRACLYGEVIDGRMRHNSAGRMVVEQWVALPQRFPAVHLDAFVVMPNHLHGILLIGIPVDVRAPLVGARIETDDDVGAPLVGAGVETADDVGAPLVGAHVVTDGDQNPRRQPTLGDIVGAFKSISTVEYGRGVRAEGWPGYRGRLWHRNYYEHIIRDEESLARIRQYIADNPANWSSDSENPAFVESIPPPAR